MKRLVLGPGGSMVYALSGFLMSSNLSDLEEISASSAGSLAAMAYLIGLDTDEILKIDIAGLTKPSIRNLLKTGGLVSTQKIRDHLLEHSSETFEELFRRTNVTLHIAVTSVAKGTVVYLSKDTAPEMRVADAVAASIAIPFLFEPHLGFLDGSLTEELPIGPFVGRDYTAVRIPVDIPKTVEGPMGVVYSIINMVYRLRARHEGPTVDLASPINVLNFRLTQDDKIRLMLSGCCKALQ